MYHVTTFPHFKKMCSYTFLKQFLVHNFFPWGRSLGPSTIGFKRWEPRTAWRPRRRGFGRERPGRVCVRPVSTVVSHTGRAPWQGHVALTVVFIYKAVQWNESCKSCMTYYKIFTSFVIWNSHFLLFIKYFQTRCNGLKSVFFKKELLSLFTLS